MGSSVTTPAGCLLVAPSPARSSQSSMILTLSRASTLGSSNMAWRRFKMSSADNLDAGRGSRLHSRGAGAVLAAYAASESDREAAPPE